MKHLLMFCMVNLCMCSMQVQAKPTTQRYKQLQRNAAYRHLSFIEIAAEIDDFPAITYLINRASLNDLLNAQVTLKEKQHQLEAELGEKPPRDIIGVASIAETKSNIQRRINQLENMINLLNTRINRMRPQPKRS